MTKLKTCAKTRKRGWYLKKKKKANLGEYREGRIWGKKTSLGYEARRIQARGELV